MRCIAAVALGVIALPHLPQGRAVAQSTGVFYHDQAGTVRSGMDATQAAHLASLRLGFIVRLPATWPRGAPLRALWVMDRRTPRFVVLYYGGNDGYITCQLHQSLGVTTAMMNWAPETPIMIGRAQGMELKSWIGGANPAIELIWRSDGVRYDLLGSTNTTLRTLMAMAMTL